MENAESTVYKQYAHCWQFDADPTKTFAKQVHKTEDSNCGVEEKMIRGPNRRLGRYLFLALYAPKYESIGESSKRTRNRRSGDGVRIHKDMFHHSKNSKTPHQPMRNDTHAILQAFYKPWNKKLEEMVGRELDWGY